MVPVDFIAPNAAHLLHGRAVAVSLRELHNNEDIWLLTHGRLVNVSEKVRIATGGDTCYGSDYGGGQGPCYEVAAPFSLSPDGTHIAFFLFDTSGAPDATPPALIVSRADGSNPRRVVGLRLCSICGVSTPSWDTNGRSFVVATERFPGTDSASITEIYRIGIRSARAMLLSLRGARTYGEDEPVVSPGGNAIAFLRNATRGPWSRVAAPPAYVYVMRANGSGRRRLPLPRRAYSSTSYWGHNALWWSGGATICAGLSADTYCLDLRTGKVIHLRHWPEASYSGLSADGALAIDRQKARRGWAVLIGPVDPTVVAKFVPLLISKPARQDPFVEFSISGR